MILALLIITTALVWLGYETNWLTVRLEAGESLKDYDCRILAEMAMEYELRQEADNKAYNQWLADRYAPTLVLCFQRDREVINPRDKWMAVEEGLDKRRNGEMLYQRGNSRYAKR